MAAFISSQNGAWHDPATWGGAGYPFELSASDSAEVNHAVDVSQDNTYAGAGSLTISASGSVSFTHEQAQSFCGYTEIRGAFSTPDNGTQKEIQISHTVNIMSGGHLNLQPKTTLRILCASRGARGVYGYNGHKITLRGTDSDNRDCVITGNGSGKETWVFLSCENINTRGDIRNVTLDWMYRYSTVYVGALSTYYANRYGDHLLIENLTINNNYESGLHLRKSNTTPAWGEVRVTSYGSKYGCYFESAHVRGGTFRALGGSSGRGIYAVATSIDGGTYEAEGSSGYPFYSIYSFVDGGTWDLHSTTGTAMRPSAGTNVAGGTWNTRSDTSYALLADNVSFTGGTINATSPANGTLFFLGNCALAGTDFNVIQAGNGYYACRFENPGCTWSAGKINIPICQYGISCYYGAGGVELRHTATKQLVLNASKGSFYNNHVHTPEPRVFVTDTANKNFDAGFDCFPRNQSDFETTGTIDWDSTRGKILVSAGGSVTFPVMQPWQVTKWGTVDVQGDGLASYTWEYRISNDAAATWTAWTETTDAASLQAETARGRGLDAIQFRVSVSGAQSEIALFYLRGCEYYSEIGAADPRGTTSAAMTVEAETTASLEAVPEAVTEMAASPDVEVTMTVEVD